MCNPFSRIDFFGMQFSPVQLVAGRWIEVASLPDGESIPRGLARVGPVGLQGRDPGDHPIGWSNLDN